jgi:hypothetical protein
MAVADMHTRYCIWYLGLVSEPPPPPPAIPKVRRSTHGKQKHKLFLPGTVSHNAAPQLARCAQKPSKPTAFAVDAPLSVPALQWHTVQQRYTTKSTLHSAVQQSSGCSMMLPEQCNNAPCQNQWRLQARAAIICSSWAPGRGRSGRKKSWQGTLPDGGTFLGHRKVDFWFPLARKKPEIHFPTPEARLSGQNIH